MDEIVFRLTRVSLTSVVALVVGGMLARASMSYGRCSIRSFFGLSRANGRTRYPRSY